MIKDFTNKKQQTTINMSSFNKVYAQQINAPVANVTDIEGLTTVNNAPFVSASGAVPEIPINVAVVGTGTSNFPRLQQSGIRMATSGFGDQVIRPVNITEPLIVQSGAGLTLDALSITFAAATPISMPDGTTATTQAPNDNSTKLATTAYADAAGGAIPITDTYLPVGDGLTVIDSHTTLVWTENDSTLDLRVEVPGALQLTYDAVGEQASISSTKNLELFVPIGQFIDLGPRAQAQTKPLNDNSVSVATTAYVTNEINAAMAAAITAGSFSGTDIILKDSGSVQNWTDTCTGRWMSFGSTAILFARVEWIKPGGVSGSMVLELPFNLSNADGPMSTTLAAYEGISNGPSLTELIPTILALGGGPNMLIAWTNDNGSAICSIAESQLSGSGYLQFQLICRKA